MKKKMLFIALIALAFAPVGKADSVTHIPTTNKVTPTKIPCGVVLSKIVWTYISIIA